MKLRRELLESYYPDHFSGVPQKLKSELQSFIDVLKRENDLEGFITACSLWVGWGTVKLYEGKSELKKKIEREKSEKLPDLPLPTEGESDDDQESEKRRKRFKAEEVLDKLALYLALLSLHRILNYMVRWQDLFVSGSQRMVQARLKNKKDAFEAQIETLNREEIPWNHMHPAWKQLFSLNIGAGDEDYYVISTRVYRLISEKSKDDDWKPFLALIKKHWDESLKEISDIGFVHSREVDLHIQKPLSDWGEHLLLLAAKNLAGLAETHMKNLYKHLQELESSKLERPQKKDDRKRVGESEEPLERREKENRALFERAQRSLAASKLFYDLLSHFVRSSGARLVSKNRDFWSELRGEKVQVDWARAMELGYEAVSLF